MAAVRAYTTMVRDQASTTQAEVGTLAIEALADADLARLLKDRDFAGFLRGVGELGGESGAPPLEVVDMSLDPQNLLQADELRVLFGAVLSAESLDDARRRWDIHEMPKDDFGQYVDEILYSAVLVEHSDAAPATVAAAVGAAAATAEGTFAVALVSAAHVGGVALIVAGPVGIVVVGVGAAYATWRLLTHRRHAG